MSVYDNDEELCKWLRANSSGDYRPSAHAADVIEHTDLNFQMLVAEIKELKRGIRTDLATHAMKQMISNCCTFSAVCITDVDTINNMAKESVMNADALLKALSEEQQQ